MHFDPRFSDGTVSWEMVWILGVAAAFLVFIACVNFVNLATATSVKRAKEVGVRKVLGGNNTQLIWQFLGETFAITLLSVLISLGTYRTAAAQDQSSVGYFALHLQISDLWLVVYLTGLTLLITLFSGLYPAWVLARIPATQAFHKVLQRGGKQRFDLRRSLIVFQFVVRRRCLSSARWCCFSKCSMYARQIWVSGLMRLWMYVCRKAPPIRRKAYKMRWHKFQP